MKQGLKKIINTIIKITILMGLFILSMASLTFYHESTHQSIYSYYNVSSRIEYEFLWLGGWTIAERPCPNEQCANLQNLNEIVGYNLIAFVISLWCILWTYLLYKKGNTK